MRTLILLVSIIPFFQHIDAFAQSITGNAVNGDRLKIGYVLKEPISLNPMIAKTEYESDINRLIFGEGLFNIQNGNSTDFGLAKSSKIERDYVWFINLKSDIFFQDGSRISAGDVKFSLELYNKFALQSPIIFSARFISSIDVIDEEKLRIYLKTPMNNFKETIGQLSILPKKYYNSWDGYELISELPPIRPVGNGYFLFRRQLPNSEIHLDVNRNHYNGRAYLNGIDYLFFQTEGQLIDAFIQGNVDNIIVQDRPTIQNIHQITKNRDYKLTVERKDLKLYYLVLNNQKRPFDNIKIRMAVNFAINKSLLIEKILFNKGHVAKNILDEGMSFFLKGSTIDRYDPLYSMRTLLSEGYRRNEEGKLVQNNRELEFELFFEKGSAYEESIARLISINLRELGINIIPHPMAPAELEFRLAQGKYQAALQHYNYDPNDSELALREFYLHKLNKENGYKTFNDRNINKLIDYIEGNPSEIKLRQAMDRIQYIINQNFPCVFLFFEKQIYLAINNRFENFRNISYEGFKFIIQLNPKNEWFVPKEKQRY